MGTPIPVHSFKYACNCNTQQEGSEWWSCGYSFCFSYSFNSDLAAVADADGAEERVIEQNGRWQLRWFVAMVIRWPVSTTLARRRGVLLLRMVANVPLGARGRYNMDGNQVSDGCEVRHDEAVTIYM